MQLRAWDTATGKERRRFAGHAKPIFQLAFSPDGKTLLSAGADDTAGLWDVAAGKRLHQLAAPNQRLLRIGFAPDGQPRAWTEDGEHGIRLWNVAAGKELRRFAGHTDKVHSACPSPDGNLLASASQDGTVRLWDMATGKELSRMRGHHSVIRDLTFAPNGWMLYGVGEECSCLWDPMTGTPIMQGRAMLGGWARAITPDSTVIIAAGRLAGADPPQPVPRATNSFWDITTFQSAGSGGLDGHKDLITCLGFSPNGKRLASGSADGTVLLWNVATLDWAKEAGRTYRPTSRELRQWWADLASADGRAIYQASWQLIAAREPGVALLRQNLRPAKMVPAEQVRTAIGELDDDRLDVRQRAFARLREIGITAEPALRKVAAESASAEVRYRAERLLEELARPRVRRALQVLAHIDLPEARQFLRDLAASTAGVWLTEEAQAILRHPVIQPRFQKTAAGPAVERSDPAVRLMRAPEVMGPPLPPYFDPLPPGATARMGYPSGYHEKAVESIAFAPDGRTLAVGTNDEGGMAVYLWDVAGGRERRRLRDPVGSAYWACTVAFAPDGQTLAAARGEKICLWDPRTGEKRRQLQGHSEVQTLAFSPDCRLLAAAGGRGVQNDFDVHLWDLATGRELSPLEGHRTPVGTVAFSADGKWLMSSSTGQEWSQEAKRYLVPGAIFIWDVKTKKLIRRLAGKDGKVHFSPDGRMLASSEEKSLCVWDIAADKLLWQLISERGTNGWAFTPDSKLLAMAIPGEQAAAIVLLDPATGKERRRITTGWPNESPTVAGFSPDGKILATTVDNYSVQLWDVRTGKELRPAAGHQAPVTSLAFTSDGKVVATGSSDRTGAFGRRAPAGKFGGLPSTSRSLPAWPCRPTARCSPREAKTVWSS